jgi:hypothetical protein
MEESMTKRDVVRRSVREVIERLRRDAGQTTAEYALVILGAAAVATALIAWATKSDAIKGLFDDVVGKLLG